MWQKQISLSAVLAVLSSLACIGGGLYLLNIQSAAENNIFEAIAHGIGIYCIGKGLYVGPSLLAQLKAGDKTEDSKS
jgi:hypothetical protein